MIVSITNQRLSLEKLAFPAERRWAIHVTENVLIWIAVGIVELTNGAWERVSGMGVGRRERALWRFDIYTENWIKRRTLWYWCLREWLFQSKVMRKFKGLKWEIYLVNWGYKKNARVLLGVAMENSIRWSQCDEEMPYHWVGMEAKDIAKSLKFSQAW